MQPLESPGNDEADTLPKVCWLETVPASPSGKEVAQWLHCCLFHAGQKTMWSTIKTWGLHVTFAEVLEACETCAVCSQEHPRKPVGTTGQAVWSQVPLAWWQVDIVGPVPSAQGYEYAITCVNTATRLLAAYPVCHRIKKL